MYVCFEYCHVEIKFKLALFFQVLVEIFSVYFFTQDECRDIHQVSRKIVKKIKTSTRKKACLNFIGASQHSKQTYIGNFVYLLVSLNTFQ